MKPKDTDNQSIKDQITFPAFLLKNFQKYKEKFI